MSAHTPGPWSIGNENNECCDVETGKTVISLDRHDPFMSGVIIITRDEMLANAHLIAAAPDLLDVLEMIRDADEDCRRDGLPQMNPMARRRLDAVLAKATGGK